MKSLIARFLREDEGQDLIEYAVVGGLAVSRAGLERDQAVGDLERGRGHVAALRAVPTDDRELIDASSVGGATFDLGSATYDMTRVATGQLDAYIEPGPRIVDDVPGMREEFERVGGGAILNDATLGTELYTKYVIVVDEDIDVSNLDELMWAMLTRSDPATSIDIGWRRSYAPAIACREACLCWSV